MINNKIILNIHYSQNIKFKIAFDHQSNTALFSHLKAILVERLEQIKKSYPEVIQQEFPPSFQIKEFSLKDKDGFDYFDNDEVTTFCSPNDEIKLFYLGNMISSQSQLDVTTQSQTQTQATIKNVQASVVQNQQPQGDQYIPILQAQVPAQPAPQIPAMTNQIAPQIANQTQAQKVLNVVPQQQQGGVMSEEQLEKLKDEFYLDTSNLDKVQGLMGEVKFQLIFPQAKDNKKQFEFWSESNKTLYELSQQILSALKLPQNYSVTLFTYMGQALTKSLNQYFTSTVQETIESTINKTFYAIISQTACGERTFEKIDSDLGTDQIFVLHQGPKVIKIDILKDTVKILKQKIYHKLDIPTHIQSLNYGGKVLQDDIVLSEYNISQNSNINLSFRMNQIVSPADSYDFNFYNPWLKHLRPQTEEGQRQLRNHLLVLFSNLQEPKFLALLRILTNNNAFVLIIKHLMQKRRLNQLQRIVLEEGFVTLFFNILIHNKKVKKDFQIESILEYTRICLGNLLKQQKNIKLDQKQIFNLEKYKLFEERCSITMKPIVRAGLFQTKKDQPMDQWCIVDFDQIALKQQTDEEIYDIPFKQLSLIEPDWLKDQYLYSKSYTNDFYAWCPIEQYDQQFIDLNIDEDIFENKVENDIAGFCKIHSAAELKQHPPAPALTKNAEKKLVIYTSMNKDVNKPINLTDIMNGQIYSENPDNLVAGQAVKGKVIVTPGNDSDEDEEIVDNKLIAQITAPFDEAIVVLVDISGSMDEQFFESKGLTRLGAVKAFFNAFADRTMAYNLKNVISLAYFEEKYYKKCGFTEAFMHFKDLVNEAKTRGKTALFTALKEAVDSLVKLREQYPHMMARIIALTDGEDNASKIQAMEVSQLIVKNNIVLDSFVVSDSCKDLHVITKSIGGKCFRPTTVQQGLSLFEYETILTARNREEEGVKPTQITTLNNFMKLKSEKQIKFDEQPYGLKLPVQIQRGSVNGQMLVNQISQNAQNLQVFAPSATLKRVMKEILDYEVKPHPFVKIFPCKDDIAFWKLILLGPENTPYYGGVYTLYIKFPSDYPQKPPEVRFLTPIYHCNINAQGRICHSVLDRNYSPDLRVIQIIQQIYGLLMTPEPDDPLDTVIASLYIQDLQTYMTKATQHTKAHANRPLDEVMNQILGQGAEQLNISDIEIQQKVQEIHEWINSQNQGQQ